MKVKKSAGFVRAIILGAAIGLLGVLVISLTMGALILSGTIPESALSVLGIVAAVLGSLLAAQIACSVGQEKRLFLAVGASLILLILLAVIHAVMFQDAQYRLAGGGIGVLCAGMAVGLFAQ